MSRPKRKTDKTIAALTADNAAQLAVIRRLLRACQTFNLSLHIERDAKLIQQSSEAGSALLAELERWRACYLDDPSDRLYHAKNRTWWRRDDSRGVGWLVSANPPTEVAARSALDAGKGAKP